MDKLEFQPTQKTPYVLLDPHGKIKFKGRSIPEDVSLFYEDILDWIDGNTAKMNLIVKVRTGTASGVTHFCNDISPFDRLTPLF